MNPVCWSKCFWQVSFLIFLCIIKSNHNENAYQKLKSFYPVNGPVLFALIMGVSYQFQHKKETIVGTTAQATSLFYKSVSLVKTVCAVAKEKVW
jgi:hypothetical protein